MNNKILVIKKDGTEQVFNPQKLRNSLIQSGATKDVVSEIVNHINKEISNGVTTDWIYTHAFDLLKKASEDNAPARFRYSLRRAVSELGPSGFPFEKYVAEVFSAHGYNTMVGKKIKGKCVTHEVDVIAETQDEKITAELKFHNKLVIKTDLKVALYVNSRFQDILDTGYYGDKKARPFLITNTKFSSNAIKYAECEGTLELMGWDYPRKGRKNLHEFIQTSQIHPVTALTSFSKKDHQVLIQAGFIICRDIMKNNGKDVRQLGLIKPKKIQAAIEEIDTICLQD